MCNGVLVAKVGDTEGSGASIVFIFRLAEGYNSGYGVGRAVHNLGTRAVAI
jgi:hypothetical protein